MIKFDNDGGPRVKQLNRPDASHLWPGLAWPGLAWEPFTHVNREHSGPPPHTHTHKNSNSSRSKAVIFKRAFAHLMMHDSSSLLFIPNECVGGCEGWMELRVCGREEGEQFQRPGVCRQTGVVGTEGATDCLKGSCRYFLYLKGIFP